MPRLAITNPDGKHGAAKLVSAANSQRPNEIQMRQLEEINKRLPSQILAELSTRGLAIPPAEIGHLLALLKADDDLNISIGD